MNQLAIIEVVNVSSLSKKNSDFLWGFSVDQPRKGDKIDAYSLQISGWALGKSEIRSLNIIHENKLLQTIPVNRKRLDIARNFPNVSNAESSGFKAQVSLIGLPRKVGLTLKAHFETGETIPLSTIKIQRQPLQSQYRPRFHPLLISSTGRSGTTWLMRLLSYHPQIITNQRYPYECRAGLYWMKMLETFSQPAAPEMSVTEKGFKEEQSWLGRSALYDEKITPTAALSWIQRDYPELFASFCQQNIDSFYHKVAEDNNHEFIQSEANPSSKLIYFAEKNPFTSMALLELYPQGKEILLIRDFRDIICSILAFNQKRGYDNFGRQNFNDDKDYIISVGKNMKNNLAMCEKISPKTHLVRYEDLILSPMIILDQLLAFLELDNQHSLIKSMLEQASKDDAKLERHRTSLNPKESIGRWKQDLDPSLQSLCNEVFAEVLHKYGYTT